MRCVVLQMMDTCACNAVNTEVDKKLPRLLVVVEGAGLKSLFLLPSLLLLLLLLLLLFGI